MRTYVIDSCIIIIIMITMKISLCTASSKWPSGTYALPRPRNGCPEFWKEGLRYHDTEDDHSSNRHSVSYHLSGSVTEHGIRQEFCVKGDSLFEDVDITWPDGQYCIYKYGSECPPGFQEGWVFWDDENQKELDGGNMVRGYTPEGVYELDTLMYFCCNNKGSKSVAIELPLTNPFYLIAFNSKDCQKVKDTTVTSEFIQWDDEDRGNTNAHSLVTPYGVNSDPWNTKIYYCYYDTGVCGQHGTICRNSSIEDTPSLEEDKNMIFENPRLRSKAFRLPRIVGKRHGSSNLAVVLGGTVAGVIVGTAVIALIVRHYLNKNMKEDAREDEDSDEQDIPLPDHIW